MLKNKTKIIAIFLTFILLFSTTFVFATDETDNNGVMPISTDESTNETENSVQDETTTQSQENSYKKSDVYLTGKDVTIDYIVDGNVFVCADTVTINSQIGGDAFILAKNLIIDEQAYVFSNIFAISDSIEIKGVVYDIYALAKNLTISKGYIYRDIKVSCNTLNINGIVGRNAFVNCNKLNFNTDQGDDGAIYGDLNYTASSEISIPENVVSGTTNYTQRTESEEKSIQSIISDYILDLGAFLAFVLIIWLVCLWLAPKFLESTNKYVGKSTLKVLGTGLLTLIAIPVACIILIFLQITSGISLLLLALYILAIVISKVLFTIVANNYICSKLNVNKNSVIFGMLVVSGIVVWVLTQIPYIGGILSFVVTVLGLGILILSILPKKTGKVETVEKMKKSKKLDVAKNDSKETEKNETNSKETKKTEKPEKTDEEN